MLTSLCEHIISLLIWKWNYNTTSTYGKGVICGAKGWRVNTFFPQSVAERNQTIILNLNLNPGIVDWDRLSERGVRPPWETVTGFK